jgi:hypothetical protein
MEMSFRKMGLRNQVLIVNIGILGGLVLEYYQGAPILPLGVAGVVVALLANGIFCFRWRRSLNRERYVNHPPGAGGA